MNRASRLASEGEKVHKNILSFNNKRHDIVVKHKYELSKKKNANKNSKIY